MFEGLPWIWQDLAYVGSKEEGADESYLKDISLESEAEISRGREVSRLESSASGEVAACKVSSGEISLVITVD